MKRFFTSVLAISLIAGSAFAEERTLIDFSVLVDDADGQNGATIMDFSSVAGTRYTEEEKQQMRTSLRVSNWEVKLNSSSQTIPNNSQSEIREISVQRDATNYANANDQVMGIRVRFPEGPYNGHARIVPPFEIPMYATDLEDPEAVPGNQFTGFGVLKNVGVIKQIKVKVYGMNFPMGLGITLRDSNFNLRDVFIDYLDFDGWRELVWNNPNYIKEVRNRELRNQLIYPGDSPAVAIDSLYITRDAMNRGGDFISYIKDIVVVYDQAVLEGVGADIDHEGSWGILAEREEARRLAEMNKLGNEQVLRYLESQKMHSDEDSEAGGQQQQQAAE